MKNENISRNIEFLKVKTILGLNVIKFYTKPKEIVTSLGFKANNGCKHLKTTYFHIFYFIKSLACK